MFEDVPLRVRRFRQMEALTIGGCAWPRSELTEFDDDTLARMVADGLFTVERGIYSMTPLHYSHLYARMEYITAHERHHKAVCEADRETTNRSEPT